MTKSSYRKTYVPLTELKTRTSLQYHYSWNTCENDLAVPVEPAKTKKSPSQRPKLNCLQKAFVLWSSHSMNQVYMYDERKHIAIVIYHVRTYSSPHYSYHSMYIRPVTICNGIQNMWYARIQHNGHSIEVDSVLFVVRVLICTARSFVQPVATCNDIHNIWYFLKQFW